MGIKEEEFKEACDQAYNSPETKELIAELRAIDDFNYFKNLMMNTYNQIYKIIEKQEEEVKSEEQVRYIIMYRKRTM